MIDKQKENSNEYSSNRCPVCNGFGTVSNNKITCHGCGGYGFIIINNKTGFPVNLSEKKKDRREKEDKEKGEIKEIFGV